jgi:REP element-mobilizing transposase RayT
MSRTALDGFVLGDVEKDFLLNLIKRLSRLYFAEIIGFTIMGNHIHILCRMHLGSEYTDKEIKKRYKEFFKGDEDNKNRELTDGQVAFYRTKWEDLSEFIKDVKQGFSRFYNKRNHRRGFFWSERFKSVIVDNGETLINCLAYIDLNPVRAKIVEKPEDYRWSSIGYHVQRNNEDGFLSLDFGLTEFGHKSPSERLSHYRRFLYEKGGIVYIEKERDREFKLNEWDRFQYRTRYFIDSGVIGSKEFVDRIYQQFKHYFTCKKEKRPKPIKGLEGVYSLKRLSEFI